MFRILQGIYKSLFTTRFSHLNIDRSVRIENPENATIHSSAAIYHSTYVQNNNGNFFLGPNSHLAAFCYVNVVKGTCKIGENSSIGPGTNIIVYSNHYSALKLNTELRICEDVIIGNNVFIGSNCVILPGTIIENDVVLGAGAVCKGKLESGFVYGGVPAKKIKKII